MSEQQVVLVTGASGVVGTALLPRLGRYRAVSLVHRNDVGGEQVRGDLTAPRLGVDKEVYGWLVERVDVVVHAAALTSFAVGERATADLNITGTQRVLDFAADAGAKVVHVSTAFVGRAGLTREARGRATHEAAVSPASYLASKLEAEELVNSSGLHAAIARPSVIIGDSVTGEISGFQGLHNLVEALLRNQLPLLPLDPGARLDVVPSDFVAQALVSLIDTGVPRGGHWLTSGDAAPTAQTVVDLCLRVADDLGIIVNRPRFVTTDMVDRLLRPVFIDPLPRQARRRFDDLLSLTTLFNDAEPFPGIGLLGPEVESALEASVRHLVHVRRLVKRQGRSA